MAQTVGAVIDRVKRILQERGTGIRWTDSEALDWLNEGYAAVAVAHPEAHSHEDELTLVAGARQQLPADGLRLLDIYAAGSGHAVRVIDRRTLDTTRRAWQAEPQTTRIERFVFDERNPTIFWVYPPAAAGAKAQGLYVRTPPLHDTASLGAVREDPLSLEETYAPAMVDYVLFRAFSKDAETPANLSRAQMHYNAFAQALGMKAQSDVLSSPSGGADDAG